MSKKILVVDDEERLRMLLQSYLRQEGFEVVTATNGREALFMARQEEPDLIILDLMMPEMDGFSFMHAHNKEASTPVIILTAKLDEQEKVLGLELGADDYVVKPYSLRELISRIRALLRRSYGELAAPATPSTVSFGTITVDFERLLVTRDDQVVELTPIELRLLRVLVLRPGRPCTREQLIEAVWGYTDEVGSDRTVDVHMRHLRQKLEDDPAQPRWLVTVRGAGYKFEP